MGTRNIDQRRWNNVVNIHYILITKYEPIATQRQRVARTT